MSIPPNEDLSHYKGKVGARQGQSAELTLSRINDVAKMMFGQRMDMVQIFLWNQEPSQIKDGWGYGYRHIHQLCKRAKMLGASLLCKDVMESVRVTLKEWESILAKALEIGDLRSACFCQQKIAELRETNIGRAIPLNAANKALMQWKQLDRAIPTAFEEAKP